MLKFLYAHSDDCVHIKSSSTIIYTHCVVLHLLMIEIPSIPFHIINITIIIITIIVLEKIYDRLILWCKTDVKPCIFTLDAFSHWILTDDYIPISRIIDCFFNDCFTDRESYWEGTAREWMQYKRLATDMLWKFIVYISMSIIQVEALGFNQLLQNKILFIVFFKTNMSKWTEEMFSSKEFLAFKIFYIFCTKESFKTFNAFIWFNEKVLLENSCVNNYKHYMHVIFVYTKCIK